MIRLTLAYIARDAAGTLAGTIADAVNFRVRCMLFGHSEVQLFDLFAPHRNATGCERCGRIRTS